MRLRRRLSWIGLLLGAVAGLAFGLIYAWIVDPVTYYDADPADLRADLGEDYLVLIATSYELTGDLARAQARLASLGQAGNPQAVAALADRL
jgi:hypothetical protein